MLQDFRVFLDDIRRASDVVKRVEKLAHTNDVSIVDLSRLRHVNIVELRAVSTAKIFEVKASVSLHQLRVLTTDSAVIKHDSTVRVPAKHDAFTIQWDNAARVGPSEYLEISHGGSGLD